ncbi:MAG: IclR family transcriptional regulator [Burkholderiaceae bacterium]|nr:IclR family transcriptional regulator [Burkholderiaceae bacterium]
MERIERSTTVQSLERGLDVLIAVSQADGPIGITDLSNRLELPKGSVSRLVTTLTEQGFLTRDPETARYLLGVKLWELGQRAIRGSRIVDIARPFLERLASTTDETVHITALAGSGEMVFLDKLDSNHALRPNIQLGLPHPLHCTANGKAMLAFLPEADLERMLRGRRRRFTNSTITNRNELMAHLAGVRSVGYAINRGEYRADVAGVAAPIFDSSGLVVAALGVSLPTARAAPQFLKELGTLAAKEARDISMALGWKG